MPSERLPTQRPGDPDAPTLIPRVVSAGLVAISVALVLAFAGFSEHALQLSEKMTIAIIALGAVAGLVHAFGIVPEHRQLRAFASPVVAWPVMIAGLATLLTS
ncbi:MAG: hypothetical protein JJ899_16225 [Alphaproteobacteria bacterium]|nr:hypothetical protein [Alphaproteobacteria bacterium]